MPACLYITINSDDPAYFGGYLNTNFITTAQALNLSSRQIYQQAENSIKASFAAPESKQQWLAQIDNIKKTVESVY